MSKDILGSLLRVLVTVRKDRLSVLRDLVNKLCGVDGKEWFVQIKQFLRKEPCWTNSQVTQMPEPKPTLPSTRKFIVKERFVRDTSRKAKVSISHLDNNFKTWFMPVAEDVASPVVFGKPYVLPKAMYDKDIIPAVGGIDKARVWLADVFRKLKQQPFGPFGRERSRVLLTDGDANIFYVPQPVIKIDEETLSFVNSRGKTVTEKFADPQYLFEIAGQWYVLRTVMVQWYTDGWSVSACSVECPTQWYARSQVFSRNSLEPVSAVS